MNSKLRLKVFIGPFVLILIGILLISYGFLNDPLWPPQDMSDEVAAVYKIQRERADSVYLLACSFLMIGTVWLVGGFIFNKLKERKFL